MKFKDGETYKVRLLRKVSGHYGKSYGDIGVTIKLRHSDRYGEPGKLCVIEGHGYGTNFEIGKDIELLEEEVSYCTCCNAKLLDGKVICDKCYKEH